MADFGESKVSPAYTFLAHYYDQLMEVDYWEWVEYLRTIWEKYGFSQPRILEAGCGTGNLTIPLALQGLDIHGVDLSPEMLAVAQRKAQELGVKVHWHQGDICNLSLPLRNFDVCISACDVLNYIVDQDKLRQALMRVREHIRAGGLWLFDLNSDYKIKNLYGDQSYADLLPDMAYFWDNVYDPINEIVTMELTFFIPQKDGLYRRVKERHQEKIWRPQVIKALLKETGWQLEGFYEYPTWRKPTSTAERWQFIVRNPD